MTSHKEPATLRRAVRDLGGTARREWRAMRRHKAPWTTGFDLDGNTLRLAQVETHKGNPRLRNVRSIEVRNAETGELNADLLRVVRELGVDRGRIVTFLPRDRATLKRLTLPTSDPEELRKMAPFEAAHFIPRAPEELLAHIHVVQKLDDGRCDVVLVAAAQEQVGEYLALFDELGLEPDKVELSTTALSRLVGANGGGGETIQPVCFIGQSRADLVLMAGGEQVFSRGIDLVSLNGDAAGLSDEIVRSVKYGCKNEAASEPKDFALIASPDRAQALAPYLASVFSLSELDPGAHIENNGIAEDLRPYAAAIGAALDPGTGLNLLPAVLVERRRIREQLRNGAWVTLLAVAALVLTATLADRYLEAAQSRLVELNGDLGLLQPQVEDVRELKDRLDTLSNQINPQGNLLEVYAALHRIMPDGVAVNYLRVARGRVTIKCQTDRWDRVWSVQKVLKDSPEFTNIDYRYGHNRTLGTASVIDFEYEAELGVVGGS